MRVWVAGMLALGVLLVGVSGSQAAPAKSAAKTRSLAYLCPGCSIGAAGSTACPNCKLPMGRLATYACMTCHVSAYRPSPCPTCREPMKYVPSQYRLCGNCNFYQLKSKKACSTCAKRARARRR